MPHLKLGALCGWGGGGFNRLTLISTAALQLPGTPTEAAKEGDNFMVDDGDSGLKRNSRTLKR